MRNLLLTFFILFFASNLFAKSLVELSCTSDDQSLSTTVVIFPNEPVMAYIGNCKGKASISNSFYKISAKCYDSSDDHLMDWHKTIDRNNGKFSSFWLMSGASSPGTPYSGLCKKADPKL